jgi:hypothetical protein
MKAAATHRTRRPNGAAFEPVVGGFPSFSGQACVSRVPTRRVFHEDHPLVGPRPLPVDEQQRIFGAARRRLSMKPGITGLWQVSGRSDVVFDDWMRLDLDYVDRWSLSFDFAILLRTIPVVLLRRGAR